VDFHGFTDAFINLGFIALREGDYAQAIAIYRESFVLCQEMDDAWGMAVSGMVSDPARAVRLLGAAEALREQVNAIVQTDDQKDYNRNVAAIRSRLDAEPFAAAWAAGRAMTLEPLIDGVKIE